VTPNPEIAMIERAAAAYRKNGCQGFIAFGGGSVIDTAKAAGRAHRAAAQNHRTDGGFFKGRREDPPHIRGTHHGGHRLRGDHRRRRDGRGNAPQYAVNDPGLIPACAVLDPKLTEGLPPAITADTGMDALTHAVEAYLALGASKRCQKLSENAVRLIFANLPRAYKNGGDMEARMNMLLASFHAGDAFTRAGLTYVHPIAHTLGGLYGTPHGRANAAILPYVLEAFGSRVHGKLAKLARAAGLPAEGKTDAEAAGMFIAAVKEMNRAMGIPGTFDFIKNEDIPRMTAWALAEANPWYPVPVIFEEAELTAVIDQIIAKEQET
jgi:alcohol dehydrogenase class IV